MIDDDFRMLISASWGPLEVTVPATRRGRIWEREIDTCEPVAGRRGRFGVRSGLADAPATRRRTEAPRKRCAVGHSALRLELFIGAGARSPAADYDPAVGRP